MSVDASLIDRSAHEIVGLLQREEVTPHDLLDTLAWRVEQVEPRVNALPTLCWERAHAHADALLKRRSPSAACCAGCRCRSRT